MGLIGRENKIRENTSVCLTIFINSKKYIYVQWYVELVHRLLENFSDLDVSGLIKVKKYFRQINNVRKFVLLFTLVIARVHTNMLTVGTSLISILELIYCYFSRPEDSHGHRFSDDVRAFNVIQSSLQILNSDDRGSSSRRDR